MIQYRLLCRRERVIWRVSCQAGEEERAGTVTSRPLTVGLVLLALAIELTLPARFESGGYLVDIGEPGGGESGRWWRSRYQRLTID